jgi:dihydrofolate reductase
VFISLIAAVAENGVIGKDNKMPWHLPADLRFFKKTTIGCPIIMGRKNFESIGKVLPGRKNIVLTKNADFAAEGVLIAHSLEEAFTAAQKSGAEKCFVIGGAKIYKQALPLCQKLYITRVHEVFEGSTYMPEFESEFKRIEVTKNFKDEQNLYDYDFEVWERI